MLQTEIELTADKLAHEFMNIGATFQARGDTIARIDHGISIGDGFVIWKIKIDAELERNLRLAFTKMLIIARIGLHPDRSWGIWLDAEHGEYVIESGRIFNDVDEAIRYGVEHDQRYGYDLDSAFAFVIPQLVEVVGEYAG